MSQLLKHHKLLYLISLILGLLYLFFINITILKNNGSKFIISSKIDQRKSFHIRRENNQSTFQCNNEDIVFNNPKEKDYWYRGTEQINIVLYKGKNTCQGTSITSEIAQKLNFTEFIILFILIGIPLFHLLFMLLIWIFNKVWRKDND
jgi:hypothetical protein